MFEKSPKKCPIYKKRLVDIDKTVDMRYNKLEKGESPMQNF